MAKYNADSITRVKGLGGIRLRPGMYVGDTDYRGLVHLVKEIVGNSIDEALNGYGRRIAISLDKSGTVTVFDEGRGIPTGPHKSDPKLDTLTIICTELHSGGKLKDAAKNYTAGAIGCFVGATKIKLLDGRSVRIDRLAKAFEKTGKKNWVYAFNKESGLSFVPRKAYGVFATRKATRLTEVVLSNGEKVLCTPDHPFMTWDGSYIQAAKLKPGQSLRAVHFAIDADGYLTHSGPKRLPSKPVKQHMYRVNRTVAQAIGMDIDGLDVAHKNARKKDNRPENLEPMERKDHWWHDREVHGKNSNWTEKTKKDRRRSRDAMTRLNEQVEDLQEQAQLGRYAQIAARAYRDYGVVTEDTYNASRPWCGPKFDLAVVALGSERNVLRAGKAYLRQYGNEGKTSNGGLGLDYKLQSEYERSPSYNANNHSVVSVRSFDTKKPVKVYGMSVEVDHNYMLDAGVFVKNTHGVGMAVVNALSTHMQVWSSSSGKWKTQTFSKGEAKSPVTNAGTIPKFAGKKWKSGTIVQFTPDLSIFEKGSKLQAEHVVSWLRNLSWFVYGPKKSKNDISGTPIRFEVDAGKLISIQRNSLAEYGPYVAKKKKLEPLVDKLKPFVFSSTGCDVLLYPTTGDQPMMYSSVSSVETMSGGTHVIALRKVLSECITSLKKKRQEFSLDDFLTGMVIVCNVKLVEASFAGQSKERLTTKVEDKFNGLKEAFLEWARRNKSSIQTLFDRAAELGKLSVSAALNRKLAASLKTKRNGKSLLPTKLLQSMTKNRDERDLFLVEGESAAGTAQLARDAKYQEVLPLRGKILNVVKDGKGIGQSQVIIDILQTIGYDVKKPITQTRRVGRLFLLTDPDPDGSHISALLMGLLYSVVPDFFREGRVFDIAAPLYCYTTSKGKVYGNTLEDVQKQVGKGFDPRFVVRMKGWGEANPDELEEIAFNSKTRKVFRISTENAEASKKALLEMLGEGAEMRRKLLGLAS